MTFADFTKQMDRLIKQWSNTYSTERSTLIWNEIKDLPEQAFRSMVDYYIGESRTAPLLPDMRKSISAYRERNKPKDERWDGLPKSGCDHCFGLGVYICEGPQGNPYAFRCHCDAGNRDPRKHIPQFKQAHMDQGYKWIDVRKRDVVPQPMPAYALDFEVTPTEEV